MTSKRWLFHGKGARARFHILSIHLYVRETEDDGKGNEDQSL